MARCAAFVYVLDMRRFAHLLGSLVCLIAACAATRASARTFYIIQSGPEAWTVMDPQGIESVSGSGVLRQAWAVRVQRNILTGNPPQPGYVRTLSEYDCDQSRVRWREFSAYSRSGSALISKRNPNPEWGPATEAGESYAAFKVVCQSVGGDAVVSADSIAKVVISLMASWDPPLPLAVVPPAKVAPSATVPLKGPAKKPSSVASVKAPATKGPPVVRPKAP